MTAHRMKTYSGESGFVYQYYFLESQLRKRLWTTVGTAYRFHVTSDRKDFFVVEVLVEQRALQAWERLHGRALVGAEQYAAAKMRLFRAFDESDHPGKIPEVRVSESNIDALLEPLHLTD
ncbi:MAG: hypothetical protein HY316_07040 [Acidobacteria bacterium]|nr:hypothetical protein [Acidobacteriota bacterium]